MLLYSVQPRWVHDQLAAGRPYLPQPQAQADHWLNDADGQARMAYDWLCAQCCARGLPRPSARHYPVWAWYQWAGPRRRRPDLRSSSLRSAAALEQQVLLTLDVAPERVVLHDFGAWHACLNYWYLGSRAQSRAFGRRCAARGQSPWRDKPLADGALHREMLRSWEAIFDLAAARRAWGVRAQDQAIQATFWALHPADVRAAVAFGVGRPRERLARFSAGAEARGRPTGCGLMPDWAQTRRACRTDRPVR